MVEEMELFKESADAKAIKELFEDENAVVVAHNAYFDLTIIKKEGIIPKNFICTLRVDRYLDKNDKLEKYNLQYLRYALNIEIEADAHDAMGDVLVLEQLFERLKKKIMEDNKTDESGAIEKMIEISSTPSIFRKLSFGKHKGKKIDEVLSIDRGWLEWLLAEKLKSDAIDEDWIYTLKHYLNK